MDVIRILCSKHLNEMALEEDDECDGSESDEGEGRAGAFKQGDEADEINEV